MTSKDFIITESDFNKKKKSIIQHKIRVMLKCYTVQDFNLNEETKKMLIDNAYVATKNHFYCKLRGLPNKMNELL